jgi:hypothetical protein
VALCSLLFCAAAAAAEIRVVAIDQVDSHGNHVWSTGVGITSPDDATSMRASDCTGSISAYNVTLGAGGAAFIPDIYGNLCSPLAAMSGTRLAVIKLPLTSGTPHVWSESLYHDSLGNVNVVAIPALDAPLAEGSADTLVFDGIQSDELKHTYFAVITDSAGGTSTRAELAVFDGANTPIATETVTVDRWRFFAMGTSVRIGRVELRNIGPGLGFGGSPTSIYAVAFVAYPTGSPRVVLPRRVTP